MKQRILTATVLIAILVPILFLSWKAAFLIPALVAVLSLAGTYELLKCLRTVPGADGAPATTGKEDLVVSVPAYLIALILPFCTYFAKSIAPYLLIAAAVFTVYLLYLFAVAVFRQGKMKFETVAEVFSGVLYITLSFASLALLRHQTPFGGYLYLLVFFGAWVTDTFAYFTGRFFGRHRLNPVISPKKTVEGSIGGIVFCMISFAVFGIVMHFAGRWGFRVNYWMLLLAGLLASVVSQVGDLITSLIKREHGVKDYGKIFPGHGGVLDRFDSVLAISPVLLILANLSLLGDAFAILS